MERDIRMAKAVNSRWTLSDADDVTFRKDAHG
jgi:hypothetical protein